MAKIKAHKLGGIGNVIGGVVDVVSFSISAKDVIETFCDEGRKEGVKKGVEEFGSFAGSCFGAKAGAFLGTLVCPVIGTTIRGILGGVLGQWGRQVIGRLGGEAFYRKY